MIKNKTLKTYIGFSKNIQMMVISEALGALAFGIFFFLHALYFNHIGLPTEEIGLIFSIGSFFSIIGFFMGPFIKVFGRKNILATGSLLIAIGIIICAFTSNFYFLLFSQICINTGNTFIQVTELQLLYSYTTEEKECCAYSYKFSVNFIATAIGTLIGGNLNKIGVFKNLGYVHFFIISAGLLIITFLMRWFLLPKDKRERHDEKAMRRSISNAVEFIKEDKKVRIFAIFLFLMSLGFGAVGPFNNLVLQKYFLYENSTISIFVFISTVLSMIGLLVMPMITEKISRNTFDGTLFLIAIATCFILVLPLNRIGFASVLLIRNIFTLLIVSSIDESMMSHMELDFRDVFAGLKLLVNGLSMALGNFIGGFILNNFGYRVNYFYGGFILTILIVLFYFKLKVFFVNKKHVKKCCCHMNRHHVPIRRQQN